MLTNLSRTATPVFIGVVVYLFTGCSLLSPFQKDDQPAASLSGEKLEAELAEINREIESGEATADIHYQKGYLLQQLARNHSTPAQRDTLYREMYRSLLQASALFDQTGLPSGKQKVDELLKITWSSEHNRGVEIIQTDSTLTDSLLQRAAGHFKNATLVLPDTAISYKMKAQAHYRNHDREKALEALEEAYQRIDTLPGEILEQLAFLYLETGRTEKAVAVYEEAQTFSDRNLNLLHGLANAYMSGGQTRKALELLDRLVENEPRNILYARARATELYRLGTRYLDSLSVDTLAAPSRKRILSQADSLMMEAETTFQKVLGENPDDPELKEAVATFYKSGAARYQKALSHVPGDLGDELELHEKIKDFLNASVPLFVSLSEQHPDNKSYLNSLYEAYSYLGMDEKAAEIKANLN